MSGNPQSKNGAEGQEKTFDLVVVGGGVAGLTAALVGSILGQRTLLIEKSGQVGGTSAMSSGTVWIADNAQQREAGITDDAQRAAEYLDALVGERGERDLRQAYLDSGKEMLAFMTANTGLAFRPYPAQPDYRQELPGAAPGWRPLEPMPFDGRTLGRHFHEVRWPIPELMLFGGMMVTRGEVARLLKLDRSPAAWWLGLRLVTRFALDRLRFRRGTRLVLGNGLVARLYKELLDRGATVWLDCGVSELVVTDGRVGGLRLRRAGAEIAISARRGVVLAGGGFPANPQMREQYLPKPTPRYTPAYDGCRGETLALAQAVGATLGEPGQDNALWFPSSVALRKDGSTAVYPHIVLDRAKPGLIAVNQAGRRFANEAASYHDFCRATYAAHPEVPCIPAWLVCERRFVRKYGLGLIHPRTLRLGPYVRRGYLRMAGTLAELAQQIGVDPAGLEEAVRLHNGFAETGVDWQFGKGVSLYDRTNGDPAHGPNPCIGPIARPPYCAVAVVPTPLGTSLGLRTNPRAQVLDGARRPIPGLYACGNDMHSPVGGEYPGAGSQLGIGMTFGYLAARHAAR